jgi:Cdc6-like AAA superfamily ATPase
VSILSSDDRHNAHFRDRWISVTKVNTTVTHITHADSRYVALLDRLSPVRSAFHDAYSETRGCLEGTREALLEDINTWFFSDGPDAPFIYWLSGMAGTGKTTISHSVCARLREHLGGSFFFSRDQEERRRPSSIFPTIMYQLATFDAILKSRICDAVAQDHDVSSKHMAVQVQQLVTKAFQSAEGSHLRSRRLLIVIDALDECDKERGKEGGEFIPLLVAHFQKLPFLVKVFITSRPEHSIEVMFGKPDVRKPTRQCVLHNIEEEVVQADIKHYIESEFAEIGREELYESEWPTKEEIEKLVKNADRFFIYAATIVKSVRDSVQPPNRRLDLILSGNSSTSATSPYGQLDQLYSWILGNMGSSQADKDWIRDTFQKVIGAIVVLQQPQTLATLSMLLNVPEEDANHILRRLKAVVDINGDASVPIRIFHPSFPDYLTDRARCNDQTFYISKVDLHN